MDAAPGNVLFAGYVPADELRDAYCGADAFVFLSHQETEGISVLEALACGTPTLVRDIPVYDNWLEEGKSVYKADSLTAFARKLQDILDGHLPSLREGGLAVAQARSLYRDRPGPVPDLRIQRAAGCRQDHPRAGPGAAPARPSGRKRGSIHEPFVFPSTGSLCPCGPSAWPPSCATAGQTGTTFTSSTRT